jgi:hypothetical protein
VPLELPLYQANNIYAARLDRLMLWYLFGKRERVLEGFVASQRAAGANSSVDLMAGAAFVVGDDELRQGGYLVQSDAAWWGAGFQNVTFPVKPGANSRYDVLGIQVRDAQASGVPGNDDAIPFVVSGSTASGTPPMPTIPPTFIPLYRVTRSASETGILTASITDIAPRGYWPHGVGTDPPPVTGVPGDLYLET